MTVKNNPVRIFERIRTLRFQGVSTGQDSEYSKTRAPALVLGLPDGGVNLFPKDHVSPVYRKTSSYTLEQEMDPQLNSLKIREQKEE